MTAPEDHEQRGAPRMPEWDAPTVLQQRADATRAERDSAIAYLRESMSGEEVLVEFGIDLSQIEG